MAADLPLDEPRAVPVAALVTGDAALPVPRALPAARGFDPALAARDFDFVPAPVVVDFGFSFVLPALLREDVDLDVVLVLAPARVDTDCGFARALGLLVAVAILGSFIWEDFAIPIFVPIELPALDFVRGVDAAAFSLFPLRPTGFDFSVASRVLDADFTLPAPVITAEGFFKPPRALAVLFTGLTPGRDITASVFVLRVVAELRVDDAFRAGAFFRFVDAFLVDAVFVPAIGLFLLTRIGVAAY